MEPYSLNTILMVFGGGIVGTALGGLWAIILCALLALVGIGVLLSGGSDFVLAQIAFGPIFGPHTGGFGAGLMAGCYAVWKKKPPRWFRQGYLESVASYLGRCAGYGWSLVRGGPFVTSGHC